MTPGERIRNIRGDMTQEEFAKRLGRNKSTVGRWERGEMSPKERDLRNIVEQFPEINPTWLLTGKGPINGDGIEEFGRKICQVMTIGDRFKKARTYLGKSQKELAGLLGIAKRSCQGYEDDSNIPGGNVLKGLSGLGININWLLTGKGLMKGFTEGFIAENAANDNSLREKLRRNTATNLRKALRDVQKDIFSALIALDDLLDHLD